MIEYPMVVWYRRPPKLHESLMGHSPNLLVRFSKVNLTDIFKCVLDAKIGNKSIYAHLYAHVLLFFTLLVFSKLRFVISRCEKAYRINARLMQK
jgi:hypothetical protein